MPAPRSRPRPGFPSCRNGFVKVRIGAPLTILLMKLSVTRNGPRVLTREDVGGQVIHEDSIAAANHRLPETLKAATRIRREAGNC